MLEVFGYEGGVHKVSLSEVSLTKGLFWINAVNPSSHDLTQISKTINCDLVLLRSAVDEDERPRVSNHGDLTQVVFSSPFFETKSEITTVSFSVFYSKNLVITLSRHQLKSLTKVSEVDYLKRLEIKTANSLLLAILDETFDNFFSLLDTIEDKLDVLEEGVLENPTKELLTEIFSFKKTMVYVHKSLTSNREVISLLGHSILPQLSKSEKTGWDILYNDSLQLVDMEATYRQILTSTLELYSSSVSNSLNNSMKRLTVYATFLMLPTLISGIYGMNFKFMPELYWKYGYAFALGLMFCSVLISFIYFKRKDWI